MVHDFETARDEDWQIASMREAVLASLAVKAARSAADIDRAAKALNLRRSMIFRLLNRYRADSRTSSLLPEVPGRSCILSEEREGVIASAIEDFFLRPDLAECLVEPFREELRIRSLHWPPKPRTMLGERFRIKSTH